MTRAAATRIVRRRLTRRELFAAAPVAGVAGTALAVGLHAHRSAASVTSKGVCRFCLLHCGIEVTTRGGQLVRVQGDVSSRTRGFLCQHGHALPEVVHSDERLRAPLVRRGDTLHEVSWAEALGLVADRLLELERKHGAEALVVQTGWPLVRHPLPGLLHRFCRAYGTPNLASVASLCESSLRMGEALTVGSKYPHHLADAATLLVWGANPERTAPAVTHVLFRRADEGHLIVVDPIRTDLARRAREHLQVRPGSDGALALGLAHVLIAERLYDAEFVAEHVSGFDAFAALAAKYPPAAVEALTTIAPEQLLRVARRMARERPARIWGGLGVEQHQCGVQTVRALVALEALTGAFDEAWAKTQLTPPGPRFGDEPLPALYRMATPEPVPPTPSAKPLGYHDFPLFEVFNREAQGNLLARAILKSDPYPVRGLMLVASNPLVTAPGAQALRQAVDALDLMVTVDPFLSLSARVSDVVLPACTFAEAATIDEEGGARRRNDDADTAVAEHGVVEPQHQAWPDWKIVFELARAMGLGRYFPWQSLREAMAARHVPFMRDDAHQPRPTVRSSARFSTPTGKIELESTLLKRFGHEPLPVWEPPAEPPGPEYPLLLVSGPREAAFINSQFRKAASVRAKVREPRVRLHPSLGFTDGEAVAIITALGRVVMRAHVTDDVHPEAVVAPFGWDEANINTLCGSLRLDPISGFPALRSTRCRVERAHDPTERK
ncbi:MAG: molybdopterin-dependent oxidoreductase [Archangiaceae bacterium]|nr:molybdopterin-dependent oxidoreductase [Archangiaceae bacterium]